MFVQIPNPVPRIRHPDWLHKKMLEKTDNFKQRRITDMFAASNLKDIEDTVPKNNIIAPVATVSKRKRKDDKESEFSEEDLNKTWREVLGNPPPLDNNKVK